MEYRNRVTLNEEDWGSAWHSWYVDGNLTVSNYVPHDALLRFAAMNDIVTPNFQSRRAAGEIINNPMYKEFISFRQSPVYVELEATDDHFSHGQEPVPLVNRPEGLLNNVTSSWETDFKEWLNDRAGSFIDLADAKASADVGQEELLALVTLSELPETVYWATSLLRRMVKIIRFYRSGGKKQEKEVARYLKDPKNLLNDATGLWLEFRYAVRPLVFEMLQVSRALEAIIDPSHRYTARGSCTDYSIAEDTETVTFSPYVKLDKVTTTELDISSRSGILYEIKLNFNRTAAIWGFDKPLSSVYEAIPFSFILDWFFSVGNCVAALDLNSSYRRLAGWNVLSVTERKTVYYNNCRVYDNGTFDSVTAQLRGSLAYDQTISRKCRRNSVPVFIQPRMNIKLNTAKLIDLLSIAQQLLRR